MQDRAAEAHGPTGVRVRKVEAPLDVAARRGLGAPDRAAVPGGDDRAEVPAAQAVASSATALTASKSGWRPRHAVMLGYQVESSLGVTAMAQLAGSPITRTWTDNWTSPTTRSRELAPNAE
ncbi:hypothetical protein [Streptomyces sp. ALI-76-A]|uniref:hypothetical protein n=1 Tax=Streptomyces sp. ALI-76-A TaxID=3025736 RepID=UPI00256EBCAC|nr:hypothetical protein [Streptomyces sp. ALI-76-A]MDL5206257.1 hypothetical protein [Streptomyces sp. ALI-76-A]